MVNKTSAQDLINEVVEAEQEAIEEINKFGMITDE